jgi:hypothetical protein
MANGDGFSEVGGGGSVLWKVKIKHGETPTVNPATGPKRPHTANGKDDYETGDDKDKQQYFEIKIKLPNPNHRLAGKKGNGSWTIYLPISKTPVSDQVHVGWAVRNLPNGLSEIEEGDPI